MEIRKLEKWEEWFESDRIIGTAFLHGWNEKEAEEKFRKQGSGEEERNEEAWGLYDDEGHMQTSFVTTTRKVMFEQCEIPISEVNMVASLPEYRAGGNVRALMSCVLRDFRERGDVFAVLHPFSFAFYRKFGFDLIAKSMMQKFPVEELKNYTCSCQVRQVRSDKDMPDLKNLYKKYIENKNLADLRTEKDWTYRGNGEFGEPDWFSRGKQSYTYIFYDELGDHAYLKYVFEPGPEGPFTGDLRATELVYDSPKAFMSVLGFIYGLRAKLVNVILEVPDNIDLSVMVPECDHVEQNLSGHLMGRVLDVEKVLKMLRQPEGEGEYIIRIDDEFLEENSGTYEVTYRKGRTVSVEKTEQDPDMILKIDTFSQLSAGIYDLENALYRPGTEVLKKYDILKQVFHKKLIMAS